jgi:hypothetical protein
LSLTANDSIRLASLTSSIINLYASRTDAKSWFAPPTNSIHFGTASAAKEIQSLSNVLWALPGSCNHTTIMKIRSTSWAPVLLLAYIASALLTTEEVVALADGKKIGLPADGPAVPASKAGVDGVGTKDAPVDGKDGRPHLGPFVETGAERDRKKAKESGDEVTVSKSVPSSIASGVLSDDGSKMPETNDGVMDDPNRTGPKEGTRGTEGGITEKSKDRKEGQSDGAKSEKKPDPPKEIPPLPHGEKESVVQKSGKDDGKKGKEAGTSDETKDKQKVAQKEIGGLEVIAPIVELLQRSPLLIAGLPETSRSS